jgi:peptide/nickel transport system ATP-binding protein/oligopeptide transport system ATP-binding protein
VLDEPTSALDVSVQARVLNLLLELQEQMDLTYLFISHDLGVISYVCDRVGVMYASRLVEIASVTDIFEQSCHPYTRALLSAMPELGDAASERDAVPHSIHQHPENGCRFAPRCPLRLPVCIDKSPVLVDVGGGHLVACHLCGTNPDGPA